MKTATPHGNPNALPLLKPARIEVNHSGKSINQMLADGEVDAVISSRSVEGIGTHPDIARLIPDYREVEKDYYRRTRIFPIMVGQKLSIALKQQVVVENRGGGNGNVGTRSVAKAAPDGYTLLLGYTGTLAINPTLTKGAGYDPLKDFAPIGMIAGMPRARLHCT